MKKYACTNLYKCEELEDVSDLLSLAIKVLGFEPKYMDVFFNEFSEPLNDISFDGEYLYLLLKKQPNTIIIKNKLYDEDNPNSCYSFSLKIGTNENFSLQTCSLSWLNTNLDFLLNGNEFKSFIELKNLVYCYCYDQYDCHNQSDTSRINPDIDKPLSSGEMTRDYILHDIDISEHWGRVVSVRGISFMAAPLMWFGTEFYKIIPKEKLLSFKDASLIKQVPFDVTYVALFDLYDEPSKQENRIKQKEFWKSLDLQNVITKYENDNPIDAVAWLKARAAQKKLQKRK